MSASPRRRPVKVISVLTSGSTGGAEFAAVELLDALAARGHDAVLMTNLAGLGRDTRVVTRHVDLGPKLSRRTVRSFVAGYPRLAWRLRSALRSDLPFDALLVHFKKEQLLTLALPRALRPLCVWAEWGPLPEEFRMGLPNRLYRLAGRRADLVLAISAGTKQSLVDASLPAEKIVVLPNAVRTDEIRFDAAGRARVRSELGIPADAFVVGCVSRFHEKKRNDVVVDATKLLDGDAHLVLAGAGETEAELRERARSLGGRVHFLPTPTSNVAQVYSAFDVSVFCPSPTEGAPRAVILAMLTERPVVATGAEGVRDLIPPSAGRILAPEDDATALATSLREYARDPELRFRLGQEARRVAEAEHAAPVVAARLEQLIAEALVRKGLQPGRL